MLNQEPQRNRGEEQRTRRDHYQSFRHPSHRSDLTFGSDAMVGAAVCSRFRPTPSRSASCFCPTTVPRLTLALPWKIMRRKYRFLWIQEGRGLDELFQLLTHPFQSCGRSIRRCQFTSNRAVH